MAWDDDKKAEAVSMYTESDPSPENSMEIVKEIAEELNESPNGVRMILTKAGVYVKKALRLAQPNLLAATVVVAEFQKQQLLKASRRLLQTQAKK